MVESKHVFANHSSLNQLTQHSIAEDPLEEGGTVKHNHVLGAHSFFLYKSQENKTNTARYCPQIDAKATNEGREKGYSDFNNITLVCATPCIYRYVIDL